MATITVTLPKLWRYRRGEFPRETLATLWRFMEAERASDKLFYAQPVGDTPYPTRGDLVAFLGYFEDPARHLLIIEWDTQVMGMVWFDDIQAGHRASLNGFYRRRFWGQRARAATRMALRYPFGVLGVQAVWAYTPWPEATAHCQAVGMRTITVLPEFVLIAGQPRDVTLLRIRREDFDG